MQGSVDIFMTSEIKLDYSFTEGQFLIFNFHSPFTIDCNKTGSSILLYVWEDIPAKVLNHDFPNTESFFGVSLTVNIICIRAASKIILK